jgi:predicted small integral membrane protein
MSVTPAPPARDDSPLRRLSRSRIRGERRSRGGERRLPRMRRDDPRLPVAVLAAMAVASFALIMYLGRSLSTFLYDEWNIALNRLDWNLDTLLRPHNEHLVAFPVLVFKTMFATVGFAPYWPYRALIAALVVLCGVLVYRYARPRIGPRLALVPAALAMLVGQGAQDVIWPFQIALVTPVACGVGLLLCLDRGTRRAERLGAGLIALALASSAVGLAVLAAGVVSVALQPDRATRALRLLAIPVVLYGAWYVKYNVASFKQENLLHAPGYTLDAAGGATAALLGLGPQFYAVAALALVALVAWRVVRPGPPPVALLVAATMPVAFWLLTALGRSDFQQPTTSRYLLPGAVFVAAVLVASTDVVRWPRRSLWVGAAIAVFATASHLVAVRDEVRAQYGGFTADTRAEVAALELAHSAGLVDPTFHPDGTRAPDVVAGAFFRAVARHGSPVGDPARAIATSFAAQRASADTTYVTALGITVTARSRRASGGVAPRVLQEIAGKARRRGRCVVFVPSAAGAAIVLGLPAGGVELRDDARQPAEVVLGRWGPNPTVKINGLVPRTWGVLKVPHDGDPTPWKVLIAAPGIVRACGRSAASG